MAFIALEAITTVEPIPGYVARFIHSEKMSLANWQISAGSPFPEHSHPHEQIMMVSEGEFELTVASETEIMRPGMVAVIPSNVEHSGRALTDCRVVDLFHPVREDYR